jgi:hypothetical protein
MHTSKALAGVSAMVDQNVPSYMIRSISIETRQCSSGIARPRIHYKFEHRIVSKDCNFMDLEWVSRRGYPAGRYLLVHLIISHYNTVAFGKQIIVEKRIAWCLLGFNEQKDVSIRRGKGLMTLDLHGCWRLLPHRTVRIRRSQSLL